MEYTVKALADLAGVTPRTLRWYDRIGLLKPLRTTEAGYRLYGPAQRLFCMNVSPVRGHMCAASCPRAAPATA